MPRTKKQSLLEKTEESIKKTTKQLTEEVKEISEKIKDEVKEISEELNREKKLPKKSPKEKESKAEETEEKLTKEEKLAKLKEKAEKLAKKIKTEEPDFKKKIEIEDKYVLAPVEDYLKSSIHLGTRAITPDMKHYVYKRRADSLAVFNTTLLDKKLKESAEFLAKYAPEDIVVVCKRDAGVKAVEIFSRITGIRAFIKKYPSGILTNPNLENFLETELLIICDPWMDKAAMDDALRIKIPVMAICDTNNYTKGITQVIPGNNKSAKSLGFIFYVLAKLYVEKRNLKAEIPPISEWVENWDNLVPPK